MNPPAICPACHGAKYLETPGGNIECVTCEGEGTVTRAHLSALDGLATLGREMATLVRQRASRGASRGRHIPWSKIPWAVGKHPNDGSGTKWREIVSLGMEFSPSFVCTALAEDADFIVPACNSHEALVEALEFEQDCVEMPIKEFSKKYGIFPDTQDARDMAANLRRVALARAKEAAKSYDDKAHNHHPPLALPDADAGSLQDAWHYATLITDRGASTFDGCYSEFPEGVRGQFVAYGELVEKVERMAGDDETWGAMRRDYLSPKTYREMIAFTWALLEAVNNRAASLGIDARTAERISQGSGVASVRENYNTAPLSGGADAK